MSYRYLWNLNYSASMCATCSCGHGIGQRRRLVVVGRGLSQCEQARAESCCGRHEEVWLLRCNWRANVLLRKTGMWFMSGWFFCVCFFGNQVDALLHWGCPFSREGARESPRESALCFRALTYFIFVRRPCSPSSASRRRCTPQNIYQYSFLKRQLERTLNLLWFNSFRILWN